VVAGAGSGKTEVIARRIAWEVGIRGVPRDRIVAFTFTERAAEEMQFRVRRYLGQIAGEEGSPTLGGLYVGTIHAFCLKMLRELAPDKFHNFDVLDDGARVALVERRFYNVLAGKPMEQAFKDEGIARGHFDAIERFLHAYDLLNEYHQLVIELPEGTPPGPGRDEEAWCEQARLLTPVGTSRAAQAFAVSAARFHALLHCRRFLDFSTAQAELLRLIERDLKAAAVLAERIDHLVVDEAQDVNPVQSELMRRVVGASGRLTAVGDHRQAIFGWRGGRVDIMGALHDELVADSEGEVIELEENFRSTSRIIELANRWADSITAPGGMATPDMSHGRASRADFDPSHVAFCDFPERDGEAEWIAETIARMVEGERGARHDEGDGERGVRLADIAILLRSATDARSYGDALKARGIPAVFRGSDLFAQPEVLLLLGALARLVALDQFMGRTLQGFIAQALACPPEPEPIVRAAAAQLAAQGMAVEQDCADRLVLLADLLHRRIFDGVAPQASDLRTLRSHAARDLLKPGPQPRRVFPQAIFHSLVEEAGVPVWDAMGRKSEVRMFHVGALARLVTSLETPGWTTPFDLRSQIIGLCMWGPSGARLPEADLLAAPDAVSIGTVHSAKGLEWPVVFLADVKARRFPSQKARSQPPLPFEPPFTTVIDAAHLADNTNYDSERRLMYVAVTRAERYLFVSCSGRERSLFRKEIEPLVAAVGGVVATEGVGVPDKIDLRDGHRDAAAERLISSFSDLRYYLECPHDFYLRKVLGFAPTIDQAFGYGRGVHNLMRAIHADPARWARLAADEQALESALEGLVDQGLFYLRYTTGPPYEQMRRKALRVVADYVRTYAGELAHLTFEPEREFETLLEEERVLISGAIDVVRRDDPPRVTLVDFKSGDAKHDSAVKLDTDEMRLQVSLYGIAARAEMEYEPERGLVRYLAEEDPAARELDVPLTEAALADAARVVSQTARAIKQRDFHKGPSPSARDVNDGHRCGRCDFKHICGLRARVER
jgi:ATP-dependent DNA helicase UvrD/PcrA